MSPPIPVDPGRKQLHELLSSLGELRNAGPRDQRFRQWRQITTTVLQRLWSAEPARAECFRRIQFSAPTTLSDPRATREQFERGCSEAQGYLEGMLRELDGGITSAAAPAAGGAPGAAPVLDIPAPANAPTQGRRTRTARETSARPATPPPFARPAKDAKPAPMATPAAPPGAPSARPRAGGRGQLKDMLGFTDEAAPELNQTRPDARPASSGPVSFVGLTPTPIQAKPPVPSLGPPVSARPASPAAGSPSAADLRSLAARLEELGVPSRQCPVVRAALIDLALQIDSHAVRWDALRAAVGMVMEFPVLARRVLPLLVPCLGRAA